MGTPQHPVTLTPEQVVELGEKLADLRHNVNNYLSLIVATAELLRRKPETPERFLDSLADPPQKIAAEVKSFSDALEKALQLTHS
jgi:hypothetical protein